MNCMVCKLHLSKAATKRKVYNAPEEEKTKQNTTRLWSQMVWAQKPDLLPVLTLNTFLNLCVLILGLQNKNSKSIYLTKALYRSSEEKHK